MQTPVEYMEKLKNGCKKEWKIAFLTIIIVGLITHLPVMINDWPNHDGLASMYFSQNMITSARWFLVVACGFSSFFTIPWVIGIFSLIFLGIGAVALIEFLEVRDSIWVICISSLLVTFPALCSTYAYIFTADGYMMALALIFLSVMLTKKYSKGFLPGGICLAFSLGIYQAYLAFALILSLYACFLISLEESSRIKKAKDMLHYFYMGIIGSGFYYLLLRILLVLEGKELDTYQGINDLTSGAGKSLTQMLLYLYHDFVAFTLKGNVLYNNVLSAIACAVLVGIVIFFCFRRKMFFSWKNIVVLIILVVALPVATNMILLISPSVTYHLLMRYQWILYPILLVAFLLQRQKKESSAWIQWAAFLACVVLIVNYIVTDNIAYSNLSKKYEKTYAYCLRLVDRMEQTEGYYTGIPVAMIGVQNSDNYPETDITESVTSDMIGMTGDYLIYTDTNYQSFIKNYLGVTINLVSDEEMEEIYQTPEYQELSSFPANDSMKVVNGILYIKTE